MWWRILRINEDKSIVLSGHSLNFTDKYGSDFTWETTSGKSDYSGSNIEKMLNEWFESSFTEKEKEMVMETTYCNDRSEDYNGVSNRLKKEIPEPTLECKREEDKVKSKVALLTADEFVMAGLIFGNSQDYDYRLYGRHGWVPIESNTWSMSPASETNFFKGAGSNLFNTYKINENVSFGGSSIVITLKPDVTISKGGYIMSKYYESGLKKYFVGFDE